MKLVARCEVVFGTIYRLRYLEFNMQQNLSERLQNLAAIAYPVCAFAVAALPNLRHAVAPGETIRVSSEPTLTERRDLLAGPGKVAMVNPREVWTFVDENARVVEVRSSAVPQLTKGDFIRVDKMHRWGLQDSRTEVSAAEVVNSR